MSLHFNKLNLSLYIEIADEVLSQHSVASAGIVGGELAAAVSVYVREHRLGYYPALDFFRLQGGVDTDLLDAQDSLAWLACKLAREEVQKKLRAAFSSIKFVQVQSSAFKMPTVRPGQDNAQGQLANHYSATNVRLDMVVTLIQKQPADENLQRYARQVSSRWLKHSFKTLEVHAFLAE